MGNLFQVLLSVVKAKITPLWTKLKLITSPTFLKTRVFTQIRKFFAVIFDIRPKNKDDYYGIGRWLVSKRLAFAIAVVLGVVSLCFVFVVNTPPFLKADADGIKTYKYNSIPLRFTEGKVKILAKSGYLAYEGNVEKGSANGSGLLYRKDGTVVYNGHFEKSRFQGSGNLYYPTGQLEYTGEFADNQYHGKGVLFRENGNKEYEGDFIQGRKDGVGTLYDSAGNAVFTGNFSKDALMYTDFLGKSTADVKDIYTGKKEIYLDDEFFVVSMPGIEGLYYGRTDGENLEGNVNIEAVYALSDTFSYAGEEYKNVNDMSTIFDKTEYEGNSYIMMPEAVAIHILNQSENYFYGDVEGVWNQTLDDVITVEDFDREYAFYLYTFVKEGLRYTFFAKDRSGAFSMYMIEME